MSHYLNIQTKIKDPDALIRALCRMGFTKDQIEYHANAQHLYGYQADRRADLANVIIRRKYVGSASNDIGFIKEKDGTYRAIISEFDSGTNKYDQTWVRKLNTYYGVEKAKKEYEARGLKYFEDTDEQNRPRLKVTL